jgi:predicted adenylyl cyclase CyaB
MKFEYEIKVQINSMQECESWLKQKNIVLSEPIKQADEIFTKSSVDFLNTKKGDEFVRIRTMSHKIQLNRKVQQFDELSNEEYECEIHNVEEVKKALDILGFKKVIAVSKQRHKFKMDKYNVCLDFVEGLGIFIEFELLSDMELTNPQEEMIEFIKKIGLLYSNIVNKGYDTLLYLKNK